MTKMFCHTVGCLLKICDTALFFFFFFNQLHYSQVKRKGNKVAHNLVRYDVHILDFIVWMDDIPLQFLHVIQADLARFS